MPCYTFPHFLTAVLLLLPNFYDSIGPFFFSYIFFCFFIELKKYREGYCLRHLSDGAPFQGGRRPPSGI